HEVAAQVATIHAAITNVDVGIRLLQVCPKTDILLSQSFDEHETSSHGCDVVESRFQTRVRDVLQHPLTNDQVVAFPRSPLGNVAMTVTVALTHDVADFRSLVFRERTVFLHPRFPQAYSCADIQNALDRELIPISKSKHVAR